MIRYLFFFLSGMVLLLGFVIALRDNATSVGVITGVVIGLAGLAGIFITIGDGEDDYWDCY